MKKDDLNPETSSGSKKEEKETREDTMARTIETEFSVLIDAEKSYEEQVVIYIDSTHYANILLNTRSILDDLYLFLC